VFDHSILCWGPRNASMLVVAPTRSPTSGAIPMALHGHVFSHEVSKAATTVPSEAVRCQVVLNNRPRFWDGRPVCGAAVSAAVFVVQPARPHMQAGRSHHKFARSARCLCDPKNALIRGFNGCNLGRRPTGS
jgi:hypothetical protein